MNNKQNNQWLNGTELLQIHADGSYKLNGDPLLALGELSKAFMKQQEHIYRLENAGDAMVAVMKDDWTGFRKWINSTNCVMNKWQQATESK